MSRSILIADDERSARETLARLLQFDYHVEQAADGAQAIERIHQGNLDAVLSDLRMPNGDGMAVLQAANEAHIPCVVMTAYGSVDIAVEAMRQGAYDFVEKPVNVEQLEFRLEKLFERQQETAQKQNMPSERAVKQLEQMIIGKSPLIKKVVENVHRVAPSRASVLITGESGTGKERVAELIHTASGRTGAFVPLHCASLSESLLESELFGHEKGAFTGANEMHKGRFEVADGGTLFLDEIGEISPSVQVKLLRVLETQQFERVGSTTPIRVDVRLVCATNRDLRAMVRENTFREDLFFRIDVVEINLAPLRERADDVPLLIKHFIKHFAAENHKNVTDIDPDAAAVLRAYPWPGNIRELRNCIERMVVFAQGAILKRESIPENILNYTGTHESLPASAERERILQTLQQCQNNRTAAAAKLGISRRTLQRKIKEYKL